MDQWSLMKVTARECGWHKHNKDSTGKMQVNDELNLDPGLLQGAMP